MRKLIAPILVFALALGLAGCSGRSMNHIIENEPSIAGVVKEVHDGSILVESEAAEYCVSLDVESGDGLYGPIALGDEVRVYYDGNVAESYPLQINTVYAITLQAPADRAVNERS